MAYFRAYLRGDNGKVADMSAEVNIPSFNVLYMEALAVLLANVAGYTQDVFGLDPSLIGPRTQYRAELVAIKASVCYISLKIVKNNCQL